MNRSLALAASVWISLLVLAPGVDRSVDARLSEQGHPVQGEALGPRLQQSTGGDRSGVRSLRPQALESRACKPQAPLATLFEVEEVPGTQGLLSVRLEVQPRIGLVDASWTLELPAGLHALGATEGAVDPRAGLSTRQQLLLEVEGFEVEGFEGFAGGAATGSASSGPTEVVLVVQGSLAGGSGVSTVERRCAVQLGAGGSRAKELRQFTDAETGARTRVAVLPSLHRIGR